MWVAVLVLYMNSGSLGVQTSPIPFPTEEVCTGSINAVEEQVKQNEKVKAYTLKCYEIQKEDFKANGKDS